jgi:hypothetical protein
MASSTSRVQQSKEEKSHGQRNQCRKENQLDSILICDNNFLTTQGNTNAGELPHLGNELDKTIRLIIMAPV